MTILICTNPESVGSIHPYSAKCTNSMLEDVLAAFTGLGIPYNKELADEISNELSHGRNFWLGERICFDTVVV